MAFVILLFSLCSAYTSMRGAFARVAKNDFDVFEKVAQKLHMDSCDSLLINSPFQGKFDACHSPLKSIALLTPT